MATAYDNLVNAFNIQQRALELIASHRVEAGAMDKMRQLARMALADANAASTQHINGDVDARTGNIES